jgi:hypothetical protein
MKFRGVLSGGSNSLLVTLVSSNPFNSWTSTKTIQAAVVNGSTNSVLTSTSYGLDSPKVSPINSTSWDWWYFDVVSEDSQSSAVVVLYTAPETGFVFAQAPTQSILEASLYLNVPEYSEPVSLAAFANNVTIVSVGNGASGEWRGTGFGFDGSPDMRTYVLAIDNEMLGVKGTITFQSVYDLITFILLNKISRMLMGL